MYAEGDDALVGYWNDEPSLSASGYAELSFCQARVTPYASEFSSWGYSGTVSRCQSLASQSGSSARSYYRVLRDSLGSSAAVADAS